MNQKNCFSSINSMYRSNEFYSNIKLGKVEEANLIASISPNFVFSDCGYLSESAFNIGNVRMLLFRSKRLHISAKKKVPKTNKLYISSCTHAKPLAPFRVRSGGNKKQCSLHQYFRNCYYSSSDSSGVRSRAEISPEP